MVAGQQHARNKMFPTLMQRACTAVARFTNEKTLEPLDENNTSYLEFYTKLVEKMEEEAAKVNETLEEESRDLLSQARDLQQPLPK